MNNVFVYIEIEEREIADVSLELLTKGRELANTLGVKLEAVVIGNNVKDLAPELAKYGADTVWVADNEIFAPFRTLPHTAVMVGLIQQEKPQIALFGATPVGRDFAPRVSSGVMASLPTLRVSGTCFAITTIFLTLSITILIYVYYHPLSPPLWGLNRAKILIFA